MKAIVSIVKKEWRTYFYSPIAYVVIGVFLSFMGILFAKFIAIYVGYKRMNQVGVAQDITLDKLALYFYQNMALLLSFITPFVTMRLFADENRQHTLELLLTSPIRAYELIIGKFLSAYTLMLLMVGISFVYAFFMILWGNPEIRIIGTTYLGLILVLACYVAIGIFISALTSSQAIAAIMTFIFLLLLSLLQSLGQGMTLTTGPIEWGPTLVYLSPLGHYNSFAEGLIHIKDLFYFITFTGFSLYLTYQAVESRRWR